MGKVQPNDGYTPKNGCKTRRIKVVFEEKYL